MPALRILGISCLLLVASAGCGGTSNGSSSKPLVLATTTQLGDFARAVGGDAIDVHQILRPNTDPHEYEPRPDDVAAAAKAKLVLASGDKLDSWIEKIVEQGGGHPPVVTLADSAVDRVAGDPHWWHDPLNAIAAVKRMSASLSAADPKDRRAFARNAQAYIAKLHRLDAGIRACFASVGPADRKLVTSHDAFNYFAQRYGVKVIGAVLPSQTTEAQPSAGASAALVRQVRREHVKAIFLENSVNPKLAKAVARETHALGNLTLYGDTLGPPGSRGATYLGMERANADAMVRGFSGGRRGCTYAR